MKESATDDLTMFHTHPQIVVDVSIKKEKSAEAALQEIRKNLLYAIRVRVPCLHARTHLCVRTPYRDRP